MLASEKGKDESDLVQREIELHRPYLYDTAAGTDVTCRWRLRSPGPRAPPFRSGLASSAAAPIRNRRRCRGRGENRKKRGGKRFSAGGWLPSSASFSRLSIAKFSVEYSLNRVIPSHYILPSKHTASPENLAIPIPLRDSLRTKRQCILARGAGRRNPRELAAGSRPCSTTQGTSTLDRIIHRSSRWTCKQANWDPICDGCCSRVF